MEINLIWNDWTNYNRHNPNFGNHKTQVQAAGPNGLLQIHMSLFWPRIMRVRVCVLNGGAVTNTFVSRLPKLGGIDYRDVYLCISLVQLKTSCFHVASIEFGWNKVHIGNRQDLYSISLEFDSHENLILNFQIEEESYYFRSNNLEKWFRPVTNRHYVTVVNPRWL